MSETILKLDEETRHLLCQSVRQQKEIMAALDNLNSNIAELNAATIDLTTAVNAAVQKIGSQPAGGASEAQFQSAADAVAAQTAIVNQQTNALNAALNPTPPQVASPAPEA